MNLLTSEGIILYRSRHLEKDLRVKLLLKDEGKILVTVKGGQSQKSRLKGILEPFSLADYQVFIPLHGVFGRLIGGRLQQSHPEIRQNLAKFSVASRFCEVLDLLLPFRAPIPEVFGLFKICLNSLQHSQYPQWEWILFSLSLLRTLGHGDYSPDIIKFLHPNDQETLKRQLDQLKNLQPVGSLSQLPSNVGRCVSFVDSRIQFLLPQRLKSDVLKESASMLSR